MVTKQQKKFNSLEDLASLKGNFSQPQEKKKRKPQAHYNGDAERLETFKHMYSNKSTEGNSSQIDKFKNRYSKVSKKTKDVSNYNLASHDVAQYMIGEGSGPLTADYMSQSSVEVIKDKYSKNTSKNPIRPSAEKQKGSPSNPKRKRSIYSRGKFEPDSVLSKKRWRNNLEKFNYTPREKVVEEYVVSGKLSDYGEERQKKFDKERNEFADAAFLELEANLTLKPNVMDINLGVVDENKYIKFVEKTKNVNTKGLVGLVYGNSIIRRRDDNKLREENIELLDKKKDAAFYMMKDADKLLSETSEFRNTFTDNLGELTNIYSTQLTYLKSEEKTLDSMKNEYSKFEGEFSGILAKTSKKAKARNFVMNLFGRGEALTQSEKFKIESAGRNARAILKNFKTHVNAQKKIVSTGSRMTKNIQSKIDNTNSEILKLDKIENDMEFSKNHYENYLFSGNDLFG